MVCRADKEKGDFTGLAVRVCLLTACFAAVDMRPLPLAEAASGPASRNLFCTAGAPPQRTTPLRDLSPPESGMPRRDEFFPLP